MFDGTLLKVPKSHPSKSEIQERTKANRVVWRAVIKRPKGVNGTERPLARTIRVCIVKTYIQKYISATNE